MLAIKTIASSKGYSQYEMLSVPAMMSFIDTNDTAAPTQRLFKQLPCCFAHAGDEITIHDSLAEAARN